MAVPVQTFTTGVSTLPDVGVLSYNGCTFSPLYESNVSGKAVEDEARRTIIYMEYTITVDGYVTMPDGAADTSAIMQNMRRLLNAQGGELRYIGRGNDIEVNVPGSRHKDVKWGPVPKILEFQPLGGGRSAKIRWMVVVQIYEQGSSILGGGGDSKGPDNPANRGGRDLPGGAGGGGGGGGLAGAAFDKGPIPPGPGPAFK